MSDTAATLTCMTSPAVPDAAALHTALTPQVTERIAEVIAYAHSAGTQRAYASAWRRFEGWCALHGHTALPAHPAVIAAYLVDAADTLDPDGKRAYAPATLTKWVAAIGDRHRRVGDGAPPSAHELVRSTLAGIRREYAAQGARPRTPRAPLLTDDVMTLVTAARDQVSCWSEEVYARRDCALLLIGFSAALRRSEVSALTAGDVRLHRLDGLHLSIRQSKTDQEGAGSVHAIPRADQPDRCPPCAYQRWAAVVSASDHGGRREVIRLLAQADTDEHVCRASTAALDPHRPLFRSVRRSGLLTDTAMSGAAVHAVIRRRAQRAGFAPEAIARLGGHSLRAGFVTAAFREGADAHAIMRQTRHRTPAMVERYAREEAPLVGNAVTVLGL